MKTIGGSAVLAALSVLTLGGCGGGGSGSPAPPVALPGPTPSPAPTPTPAPPPTYAAASDFTADREYSGWGVQFIRTYRAPPTGSPPGTTGTSVFTTSLATDTRAVGFHYRAATQTYVVRWFQAERAFGPVTSILFLGFRPIDYFESNFSRSQFSASPTTPDYTRHVGSVRWVEYEGSPGNGATDSVSRSHYSIFGVPTVPTDLPSTGTYRFETLMDTRETGGLLTENYRIGEDVAISVDWATGAVTGSITFEPGVQTSVSPIVLTISGTIDRTTSRVSGTITGIFSGSFSGSAFGPQGRELGIAMVISNGAGGRMAGVTGGRANGMPAG